MKISELFVASSAGIAVLLVVTAATILTICEFIIYKVFGPFFAA